MVGVQKSLMLFGLDLSAVVGHFRAGWREAKRWPVFAWLRTSQTVRVLRIDGSVATYLDDKQVEDGDHPGAVSALMLPDEVLLRRPLRLPRLLDEEVHAAASLEVAGVSPFDDNDLLWGYVSVPQQVGFSELRLAITSRRQVERCLEVARQSHGGVPPINDDVQFWVAGEPPIVLRHAGSASEPLVPKPLRSGVRKEAWLMLLAAVLCAAVAVTPTAQLRFQAIEAQYSYDALAASVRPQIELRERLVRANQQLQEVAGLVAERGNPLAVLDELTRL